MTHKTLKRFPLLIYQTLAQHRQTLAFWLIPGGIALWWIAGQGKLPGMPSGWVPLMISLVGLLLFLHCLLARHAAVHCHARRFTVQTPFYPVTFSYRRIENVRPVAFNEIFPPEQEKDARVRFYQSLWGRTAVVVTLKKYPLPLWWLQIWANSYLLAPKGAGLILLVDEWMALTRQLELGRERLRESQPRR